MQKLTDSIKLHEGFRARPYVDTTGHMTIGYGLNLDSGITESEARHLLCNRLQSAIGEASTQAWWACLGGNDARERAMVEMVYNLGVAGVAGFKNAIQCLCANDFSGAATHFLDSLWHKQVGHRAEVLAQMIMTGEDA